MKSLLGYATADGKPHVREALRLLGFAKADFPTTAAVEIEKMVRAKTRGTRRSSWPGWSRCGR